MYTTTPQEKATRKFPDLYVVWISQGPQNVLSLARRSYLSIMPEEYSQSLLSIANFLSELRSYQRYKVTWQSKTFKRGRPLQRGRLPTPYTWDNIFSSFKNKHVFSAIMFTISQVIRTHRKLNYSSLLSASDEVTRETMVSVRNSRQEVI